MHKDRKFTLLFALTVMVLTSLPYLLGFALQGSAWRFSGFVFGVEDGNSYIAKMLSGAAGAWLFRTPYTASPQHGALAYLPYLLLGKLSAPPAMHTQLVALYHLYRFAAGVLAILASSDFLACFVPEISWRRWALALVTLGGGLGWLVLLLGGPAPGWQNVPLEFYSPESFAFLALYGLPHLALARALFLWGLLAFWQNKPLHAGLLWLGMGFFQPLDIPIAWTVLGAGLGLRLGLDVWRARKGAAFPRKVWQRLAGRFALSVGISSPLVLYTLLAFHRDPFLRAWAQQNIIASPPPPQYLLAYGLLLPFTLAGMGLWLRQALSSRGAGDTSQAVLVAWVLLLPLLAYAPYNLQRRLPEGVWVALVILAVQAAMHLSSLPRFRLWSALTLPSTFLLLAGGVFAVLKPAPPIFLPAQEGALFEELATSAQPGDVALCAYTCGNNLPAWAPVRVVIGHGPESANLSALQPRVNAFYQSATDNAERRALLQEFHVRWVLWGPEERALGNADLYQMPFLRPVAVRGEYVLFEVVGLAD